MKTTKVRVSNDGSFVNSRYDAIPVHPGSRQTVVPLIDVYRNDTKESQPRWIANGARVKATVKEIAPLQRQTEEEPRQIVVRRLTEWVGEARCTPNGSSRKTFLDVFRWSHVERMDLVGVTSHSLASARVCGGLAPTPPETCVSIGHENPRLTWCLVNH